MMAQADQASSWRLIDAETHTLLETIRSLKSLPHSLGLGSNILLKDELGGDTTAGPRSHMWLLQSAAKYACYRPSEHAGKWKTRVAAWSEKAKNEPEDAWQSMSVLHLLGTIAEVEPDFFSELEANGLANSELERNVIAGLESEVTDGTPYRSYWLYQALAVADPGRAVDLIQVNWIEKLDKELAAVTASKSEVNHLDLASAASLALLSGQYTNDGSRESRHIDAAFELLSGPGDLPAKRAVVNHGRYQFLHSLPFEELLILGKVDPTRFPTVLPRFVKLSDFLESRRRKIGDDAVGVSEESSPLYPEVAPYATGYMGVLTHHILKALRNSLKRQLAKRLQQRSLLEKPGPAGDALDPFLDTEERVFKRLSEDLTGCIDKGVMDFEQLSLVNTILLFGPPGTGKTTVVKQLASHLKDKDCAEPHDPWYFLPLSPSVFLVSDTFTELLSNIEEIFSAILETERAVFFFDEAEELMRRRDKDDSRIGRLFTSAMLIHLDALDKAHSVSVFATNFINMIDKAASRPGRFAIRKGVGPAALSDINSHVASELGAKSRRERDIAEKCLEGRVAMEVIRLCKKAKTKTRVDENFFDSHRRTITPKSLEKHKKDVEKYDDP